ncbi:uncharacterized protein LOC126682020 [Mercurialis annua]|uniref:uncharacterized protein LOC126682020 n=1 Tax=Mercurialis annua TaxID=3986 RepID=UPI00215E980D|nr:uncharacterized protein LOC126682020 [Mercurialis annua]
MPPQDFSFPTLPPDPLFSGIDSPPLWRLSPSASPAHNSPRHIIETKQENEDSDDQQEEDEEFKDCFPLHKLDQRKSFSWVEKQISKFNDERDDESDAKEEKMDMLWENFNDDNSSLKRSGSTSRFDYVYDRNDDHDPMTNTGCVQSLRLSKTGTKKSAAPGFVVFIKILKKLFLLHNSNHHRVIVQTHRSRNTRPVTRSW